MQTSNKTNMATGEKAKPAYFVYAGHTADNEQHLYYVLEHLTDNDGKTIAAAHLETFYTSKKIFKTGSIGGVYAVELKNSGKTVNYKRETRAIDYWKTKTDLIQWRANDAAAGALAVIKKQGEQNHLYDALQPIRRAYNSTRNTNARAGILAEVIRIITA